MLQDTYPGQIIILAVDDEGLPTKDFKTFPGAECFIAAKRRLDALCLWNSRKSVILGNKRRDHNDLKAYIARHYPNQRDLLIPSDNQYNSLGWFLGTRICKPRICNEGQFCIICKAPAPHSEPNLPDNLYACSFCSVSTRL